MRRVELADGSDLVEWRDAARALLLAGVPPEQVLWQGGAQVDLLGGLFAFGATIAFTIAHASVIRMRITEPDRERPFRIPFDVNLFGGRVPLPTVGCLPI